MNNNTKIPMKLVKLLLTITIIITKITITIYSNVSHGRLDATIES